MNFAGFLYDEDLHRFLRTAYRTGQTDETNNLIKYVTDNNILQRGTDTRTYIRYIEYNKAYYIQDIDIRFVGNETYRVTYGDILVACEWEKLVFDMLDYLNVPAIDPEDEIWQKDELLKIYNELFPDAPLLYNEQIPDGFLTIVDGKLNIDTDLLLKLYTYVINHYSLNPSPYINLTPEYRTPGTYSIQPNHLIYEEIIKEALRQHNIFNQVITAAQYDSWAVGLYNESKISLLLNDDEDFKEALKTDKYHMCVGIHHTVKSKYKPGESAKTSLYELDKVAILIFRKHGNAFNVTDVSNVEDGNRLQTTVSGEAVDSKVMILNVNYPQGDSEHFSDMIEFTVDSVTTLSHGIPSFLTNYFTTDLYNISNHGIGANDYWWLDSVGFERSIRLVQPHKYEGPIPVADEDPKIVFPDLDNPTVEPREPSEVEYPQPTPRKPVIKIITPEADPDIDEPEPEDETDDNTLPDVKDVQAVYGLYHIHKLTLGNVKSLGMFLWQEDTITAITNMFKNNPMDAIISLHQLYVDPTTTNSGEIKLGYIPTGITTPIIEDRYQEITFNPLLVKRYFNDVRDYETKLSIYLPFIGIKELDITELLDRFIRVRYYVDVLTGDCLCTISKDKQYGANYDPNQKEAVLYMFNGNCSVPLPLTGADKSRLYQNIMGTATGVVGGIAAGFATGGPIGAAIGGVAGLAGGAVKTATTHNYSIEKSGNVGGNFGAMAFKQPYFIYQRPLPADANNRGYYIGKPCNVTITVGNTKGYAEFSGIHVDTLRTATETEKHMIEQTLQSGVIL